MPESPRERDSIWKLILVPVVLALLIGSASPWWWDRVFPPSDPVATSRPVPTPPPGGATAIVPGGGGGGGGATAPPGGTLTDCTLTVSRPFSEMRAGPNYDETRVGDVPEGTSDATETTLSEWANTEFRWFRITAAGRDGWIVDNGFMFQAKSAGCP